MTNSISQINSKKTVFSAQNILLKRSFLILFLLLSVTTNYADNVDFNTALRIARAYVNTSKKDAQNIKTRAAATATQQPYYIFNDEAGKGFVVIAGDDKMGKVLAYSKEASINMANLNPEARYLFDTYQQVYEELSKNKTLTTRAGAATKAADAVQPLLKSKWGQDYPYSKQTRYMTGCVATAVAQVMYYHKWPTKGKGQESYTVKFDNTVRSADFTKSHYDWDNMLLDYNRRNITTKQEDAVALLMNDVGIATNMQYTDRASGTQSYMAERALRNYFDYDAAMVTRSYEGVDNFIEIVKEELRNGFPLYISGDSKTGGGHAWVCDGFDEEDRFHMNFGWNGQANGYYSLATLNVTSTGSEFNGAQHSFNRRLHVIAIHPNKPGTPKIDADIAYQSPNINFDYGSDMAFVGDAPTTLSATAKVMYSRFINQSQSELVGDIGLGIYDQEGKLVKVTPYGQDGRKIFTKDRFVFNEGKWVSGGVIDDKITFTLDFTTLTDGIYSLYPIAARTQEDGTLGAWARMKKAPRIVMKVKNGNISYLELPSTTTAYQLTTNPGFDNKVMPGEPNVLRLNIRKLDANFFNGTIKAELINSENKVVFTTQTDEIVDFDVYTTKRVRMPFNLPYDIASGTYHLRTTITNADNVSCQVRENASQKPYTLTIEAKSQADIFSNAIVYAQDNEEGSVQMENFDVSRSPTFRLVCIAYLAKNVQYKGGLTLYLIDTVTGMSIQVTKKPLQVDLTQVDDMTMITSEWIDPKTEKFINNRRYRVALFGVVDGKNVDLLPISTRSPYLSLINGPHDKYPEGGTNGVEEVSVKPTLQFVDGCLHIQQQGLRRVEVYGMNGILVASSAANGTDNLNLSIPKGTYVVRIITQGGRYTSVIR
ncbi:thiol protease/hemagglutinin PrtT [Prevotella scopos JCM 17725]|uniref:Por secretion system C-terminal sorting domain-containing protein n=2 Tax=Prevotella TaxID=838 RepID=A0AAX2F3D4_9BACT|nr:thiol protease/hemagglutinin PrtT [Prevotella scopos]QUB45347.1 thiol protease/hemagglutinin PrtT [Prevotella scopos JCM 17725]SHF79877.1 Por secretion system C-terminal sorting domain-containing protein [Prevotella scopos JCM 17725]